MLFAREGLVWSSYNKSYSYIHKIGSKIEGESETDGWIFSPFVSFTTDISYPLVFLSRSSPSLVPNEDVAVGK